MAELAQVGALHVRHPVAMKAPRHPAVVRATHWIHTFAFLALLVSGFAILLAHPRFYWGETGAYGSPALIELPLPLNLDQSGWGRSLHFLAAWICVLNGAVYGIWGLISGHFRIRMVPDRSGIRWHAVRRTLSDAVHWRKPTVEDSINYNAMQRLTYLGVVFVLTPLIVVTGLAMSPAVAAAVPVLPAIFGGHQSSRTIHFIVTGLLVLFLIVHLAMLVLAGFTIRAGGMITGAVRPKNV